MRPLGDLLGQELGDALVPKLHEGSSERPVVAD
jgi:hypothetical protein